MIFDEELYKKNIYLVEHILDKNQIRPLAYFQNLGLCSDNIAKIGEICNVILNNGGSDNFYSVDVRDFDISIKLSVNTILFKDVSSRKVYDHFITDLQRSYTLTIRDGKNDFQFSAKETKDIFIKPRITTLLLKIKEFQYKLLHGAIYTKEHLLRFGFVEDDQCSFCKQMTESYLYLFWDCVHVKPLWLG